MCLLKKLENTRGTGFNIGLIILLSNFENCLNLPNHFLTKQDALSDIELDRIRPLMTPPGVLKKASIVWFIHFNNLSH